MKHKRASISCKIVVACLVLSPTIGAYNLPSINLGSSNILDGGPIRPLPGRYWTQISNFYHADTFLDGDGKPLDTIKSPQLTSWSLVTQLAYQTDHKILFKGNWGIDIVFRTVLYSDVTENRLRISSAGFGFGDISLGAYLQWDPIKYHGRPVFVHRLTLTMAIPVGTNNFPINSINPGSNIVYFDPYWAATLYFTETIAASWRIHYLWNATNSITGIQAAPAIHLNYSFEGKLATGLWGAINGYFLKQIKNNTLRGCEIPNSRTQIFSVGPGILYYLPRGFIIVGNLYFETKVKNSTQGIQWVTRIIKYF